MIKTINEDYSGHILAGNIIYFEVERTKKNNKIFKRRVFIKDKDLNSKSDDEIKMILGANLLDMLNKINNI